MKAIRIHEFGGPEVLRVEDLPLPDPAPGELLVRIRASSVNPVDYKIRKGGYLPADQLPLTLGRDMAGVVDRVGPGVDAFQAGSEVYAMLSPEKGGYAEFVAARAQDCAPKPARLDFVQAAAVPLAALTAWQGLFDHGHLTGDQRLLIHGAAGGVGHFAVQFARVRGCHVTVTASGSDRDFLTALGADEVIDYHAERFEDRVSAVDMVFDLVGGETRDRSWAVLKEGGTLVSTLTEPDQKKAAEKHIRAMRYTAQPNGGQLAEIGRQIDMGLVMPQIARVFPLQEAARAEQELETQHVRGKIVLEVAG